MEYIGDEKIDAFETQHIVLRSIEGPEKEIHYWIEDNQFANMIQKRFNIPEMGGAIMTIKWINTKDMDQ